MIRGGLLAAAAAPVGTEADIAALEAYELGKHMAALEAYELGKQIAKQEEKEAPDDPKELFRKRDRRGRFPDAKLNFIGNQSVRLVHLVEEAHRMHMEQAQIQLRWIVVLMWLVLTALLKDYLGVAGAAGISVALVTVLETAVRRTLSYSSPCMPLRSAEGAEGKGKAAQRDPAHP